MQLFRKNADTIQTASVVLFCTTLVFFFLAGGLRFNRFRINLGSLNIPTDQQIAFWGWWQDWSLAIVLFLAIALLHTREFRAKAESTSQHSSHRVQTGLGLFSVILSLAVHYLVLKGALLTDDESAYQFAAQTLSHGQLSVPSPELKHFFDRVFMINDGQLFPQYFYGWPIVLSLGEFLHVPQLINPILFGGSTVLLHKIIMRNAGQFWALIGCLGFLGSPLALINSATFLTHPSSTFFLLAAINSYQAIKIADTRHPDLHYFIVAASSCIVFLIRPYTALLILAPVGIAICHHLARKKISPPPLIAMAVPIACFAALFIGLNIQLNGSAFSSGYDHYLKYANENYFIYSWWNKSPIPLNINVSTLIPTFNFLDILISTYYGILRLGHDGIALPFTAVLVVAIALGLKRNPTVAVGLLLLIIGYARWNDLGIDTYGPTHLSEGVPLAIILLAGLGCFLAKGIDSLDFNKAGFSGLAIAGSLGFAIVISDAFTYTSIRINQVKTVAGNIQMPYDQARLQGIKNAVVFVKMPFINQTSIAPMFHFRFWRDNPKPDLSDSILWVNYFDDEEHEKLMDIFPDRTAFEMSWSPDGKTLAFNPLPKSH